MNDFELKYKIHFDMIHKALTRAKELLLHAKNKDEELAGELCCQIAEMQFQSLEYFICFDAAFLKTNGLTREELEISNKEYKNRFSHLSLTNPIRIRAEM